MKPVIIPAMKIFILIVASFLPVIGYGQAVVADPVLQGLALKAGVERTILSTNAVKTLSTAVKSTAELKKTTDFLKKNHERLSKVNATITNLSRLSSLISRQKTLISNSSTMVSELESTDLFSPDEINTIHSSLTKMIKNTNDIVKMLDLVLKPKTQMSDGERLSLLRDLEKDFSERQTLLEKNVWDYKRIKNQRLSRNAMKMIQSKKE